VTESQRFVDLEHAARELAAVVPVRVDGRIDLVLALGERALPIAGVVAQQMACDCVVLLVERSDAPVIVAVPECAGMDVMVVDRASALREAGVARLTLAVPVCPRQAEWTLAGAYDDIIALQRPLGRRSLQWHFIAPLE